jgi:hypothetical protein
MLPRPPPDRGPPDTALPLRLCSEPMVAQVTGWGSVRRQLRGQEALVHGRRLVPEEAGKGQEAGRAGP